MKISFDTHFEPGDILGERYVIDELLGEGRTGTVYRGRNVHLGHAVALKIYRVTDRSTVQRFERSAQVMAEIRSSNVVSLLDYWLDSGTPVMVTEYTPGQSLQSLIAQQGAVAWPTALAITREILRGLHAIHDSEVLHRNLTPTNVIVSLGTPPTVKLTDLSLAKPMASSSRQITRIGMVVGNPAYLSPEQLLQNNADARSDIFSAGVLLYKLVTGRLPRQARDLVGLVQTLDTPLIPPVAPQGHPPLPSNLIKLLGAVLQRDPTARPQSAKDFAQGLQVLAQSTYMPPAPIPTPSIHASVTANPHRLRLSGTGRSRQVLSLRTESITLRPPQRKPADKEVFQTPPGLRIRALLAGHLPDDGATHVKARQWLATIVPEGQQFFVGNDFWVAVILSNSDENARQQGRHITANIAKCYGDEMPVRAQMVDETFVLSQSCLDGTSPPPFTVLSLLEQLARARRDETSQDYRGT